METDQELLHRHKHVSDLLIKATKQLDKMKFSSRRDQKARWCGSLQFILLQIKSEIEERNLNV